DLDNDRAGIPDELAAWPVEARIQRERIAWRAQALVERDVARHVVRLGTGRAARALGPDADLTALRRPILGITDEFLQRGTRTIATDEDVLELETEPSVERNVLELFLEHDRRIVEKRDERERIPRRLMLRHDEAGAIGKLLAAADFHARPADDAQQ